MSPAKDPAQRWTPLPVDAVVFDLGNVLIRWDPAAAVAAAVGAERAAAFVSGEDFDFAVWNAAHDAGRPWDESEREAITAHPHLEDEIRGYRAHFALSLVAEIAGTVEILRELHAASIPVLALTNWSAETFPIALERFDFLDLFEDIIVSGEEGVAKPDPEIFEILEERISHLGSLDDCVFIDDSLANVAAAQESGLDAIHFTDPEHLRHDLVLRGLPLREPDSPDLT
jgi:2-haloacid dehalogenase